MAKLAATSVRTVLEDFELAKREFEDKEVEAVGKALQLSVRALSRDSNQLPSQMMCRISQVKHQHILCQNCMVLDHLTFLSDNDSD